MRSRAVLCRGPDLRKHFSVRRSVPWDPLGQALALASEGSTQMSCVAPNVPAGGCDSGDTAWLMCSACLVLLMHPALAIFYGGMVSDRSIVNTMLSGS